MGSGGTLGNTAIAIGNGGTFAVAANRSAGTTDAGTLGATIMIASGGNLDLVGASTFNLNQQAGFGAATDALTLTGGGTLLFGLGTSSVDRLSIGVGKANVTGSNTIDFDATAAVLGGSIAIGNYTLISAAGGLNTGFTLGTTSLVLGGRTYLFSLTNSTNTTEILTVSVQGPTQAYWSGAVSGSWNEGSMSGVTNWRTDATSNVDTQSVPGGNTNVFVSTIAPVACNRTQ